MAKVTVTICDVCKQRIATRTCPICGRDMCDVDTRSVTLEIGLKFGQRMNIYETSMCEDDYKKLQDRLPAVLSKLIEKVSSQTIESALKESLS
ncbi:MAG: hypothetical protein QXX36_02150 [Candidatus Rehaiarchaeum fermentans]|nr:hypothetical protein [Candidatus Rehaiarchaeum fermentans]MCW1292449.1 hypothetical protein [Candidatus Rehaiarchaeum fermentans]MCW1292887.1 hypothetical protein [Candidatus Rehaiarchaeum fermentans]MCW1293651.1 hypothetical protein [Candidatus Rehaiarchaeum fermentans]MCW1297102.1 hypothetical protein [Candidatus Rehaiarchaeum fermentans]